jgi:D-apionolactonase
MDDNPNLIRYGRPDPLPARHPLRAGPLALVYERGALRTMAAQGTELLRGLYSAVRDHNWGTVPPVILEEQIDNQVDSFNIRYLAQYQAAEISFRAEYHFWGTPDGTLGLALRGVAETTFRKNRIGFCALHPLRGLTGQPCTITHPGGQTSVATFPALVSPHQPMLNIQGLAWETGAARCQLTFTGDVWEMEDQRNWTDSSFKIYCTPLARPFPVEIVAGTEVVQEVVLKVELMDKELKTLALGTPPPRGGTGGGAKVAFPPLGRQKREFLGEPGRLPEGAVDETITFQINPTPFSLPRWGFADAGGRLSAREGAWLRHAGAHHLRIDLKMNELDWTSRLADALANARDLGAKLELALHFTANYAAELAALRRHLAGPPLPVALVWAVDRATRTSTPGLVAAVAEPLRQLFPAARVGGGTDANFAEFNRQPFGAAGLDFVTFAVNPQVHAFDNQTLVENLEAQADALATAAQRYPGQQLVVSPVTLRPRFNVVATGPEPEPADNELPSAVDERQMSLFAAGWTLGSLAALTRAGCHAATYYQTVGWQGLGQGDTGPARPALFAAQPGEVFPVYHLFRFLAGLPSRVVREVAPSHPLRFSGLALGGGEGPLYLVLASHHPEPLAISLVGHPFAEGKKLDETNADLARQNPAFLEETPWQTLTGGPVVLPPFGLVFLR